MAKYQKLVAWEFNHRRLSEAMIELLATFTTSECAELLGVSPATISHWKNANYDKQFAHPNMSNFIIICNELDLDPREFFTQEDV